MMEIDKGYAARVATAHAVAIGTMNMVTTVFLHRGETHGTIEVGKPVREFARLGTWLLSGMKPREWVGVHRRHHDAEDTELDPHSPVQNGRFGVLKVFVGNGLYHYKKAAKQLTEEEIPEHLRPDRKDEVLYDKGWLGQVALFGLFTVLHRGNAKKGAVSAGLHSLIVHDVLGLSGGGFVNSVLHRGRGRLLDTMIRKPEPNEDGTFTINSSFPAAVATFGEGNHDNHHKDPTSRRFHESNIRDIGGFVADQLIKLGLAQPGRGPRK